MHIKLMCCLPSHTALSAMGHSGIKIPLYYCYNFTEFKLIMTQLFCRTRRKECNFNAAVDCATQVISFRPTCYEAFWARAKARRELNELDGALTDLREAIKLSPKNLELHRFTMQVKAEIEARPPTANGHCNPGII